MGVCKEWVKGTQESNFYDNFLFGVLQKSNYYDDFWFGGTQKSNFYDDFLFGVSQKSNYYDDFWFGVSQKSNFYDNFLFMIMIFDANANRLRTTDLKGKHIFWPIANYHIYFGQ